MLPGGAVAAGSTFRFVVVGTLPTIATTGQTNTITVNSSSVFDSSKTASLADVTTVSSNAVLNVTESISASSGAPGSGPYTYTFTYTNTGNSTLTALRLTDIVPAGMTYVAGSARWSVTGSTALTDATGDTQGTAPNTIDYSITGSTLVANIAQVVAGQSGSLTFQVNVPASTANGTINNTGQIQYNDGSGSTVTGSSNTVPFTVVQNANVSVTAPPAVASAAPGSTVSFSNVIKNLGNGTDTFDVSIANAGTNGFPAGTTFLLFKADGVTPLTDSNGDSIADTGPLAPNASYTVVVKAQLPASANGGPFNAVLTATSIVDGSHTATGTDTITSVSGATVDLTNNSVGGPGAGAGPEASPVFTRTLAPGSSSAFSLVIANTSASIDSYDLASSTASNFSAGLPAGWTVTFKSDLSGDCSSTGATLATTGAIAPGTSTRVCAIVTVPATGTGSYAGNTELYFRAQSSASGAVDALHDRVTISAVRSLVFAPNQVGQAAPGGATSYTHTLTNAGNTVEGDGVISTITFGSANSRPGYTSTQYYDANNNGVLDASDPQIPAGGIQTLAGLAGGLAPGQSITIFDKVFAPAGAAPGDINATTVTVTTANGTGSGSAPAVAALSDTTNIVLGNLTLVKEQALDANCTGAAGGYVQTNITTGAVPNACIRYRITVTNVGSVNALSVVVSDATPLFTLYDTGGGAAPAATTLGTITAPAPGGTGSVMATVGTLTPGSSAAVTFGVRIQP